MSDGNSQKLFKPELETIEEFLERWKAQNLIKIMKLKPEEAAQKAMLLVCALPVDVLTDIQRKLKPKLLSDAKYEDIEEQLKNLYSKKKSLVGAAVTFLTRKQKAGESIEVFAKKAKENGKIVISSKALKICC